jgi:hypothetical protein
MRLECKEVKHKDYHPDSVLTEIIFTGFCIGSYIAEQATELHTQQKAPPYGDGKADSLVCVHQDSAKQ